MNNTYTAKPTPAQLEAAEAAGELRWAKSSFSNGAGGMCVEVAALSTGGVALRDSKDPGKVLLFSTAEWRAFRDGVDNDEFRI